MDCHTVPLIPSHHPGRSAKSSHQVLLKICCQVLKELIPAVLEMAGVSHSLLWEVLLTGNQMIIKALSCYLSAPAPYILSHQQSSDPEFYQEKLFPEGLFRHFLQTCVDKICAIAKVG